MKGVIGIGAAAAVLLPSFCLAQTKSPNVILLMADDLGWGDVGFNGNEWIKTPVLDSMARNGIVLSNFYTASSVSSPTRASVLTGRNPYRTGVFSANTGILRPEEVTIAEVLKAHGYNTGHFGKWHLGTLTYSEVDANRGKVGNMKEYNPPALHGYDEAFVTESKVPTWDPMKKPVGKKKNAGWKYLEPDDEWEPFGTSYWDIGGQKVTENLDGDDSRVIMDRVIPFIDSSVGNNQQFLAVVWFHAPHLPCVAGPEYSEMYKDYDLQQRNYAGCITAMDAQIGRLLKHLKETGVDKNTVIFFCSDNGPENGTPGTTGVFRERKRSLHEGGIRVPSVVYWPGRINPKVSDCLTSTMDYFPTIIELTGADRSIAKNMVDGKSFADILTKDRVSDDTKSVTLLHGKQVACVKGKYKMYNNQGNYELYNIRRDPSESKDLSKSRPRRLKKMIALSESFIQSYKSSFLGDEYGTASLERTGQRWD